MNREQAKALLPIITAYSEGKTIQYLPAKSSLISDPKWADLDNWVAFNFSVERYRIKPEPLKVWITVHKRSGADGVYTKSHDTAYQALLAAHSATNYIGTYPMEIEL